MRATDRIERLNIRERRAQSLTAAIMNIVRPYVCEHDYGPRHRMREISEKLQTLFFQEGIEVLSDYDRQQYGLPPRGPDGWTTDEVVALERRKLEILTKPIVLEMPTAAVTSPARSSLTADE